MVVEKAPCSSETDSHISASAQSTFEDVGRNGKDREDRGDMVEDASTRTFASPMPDGNEK